MKTYRFNQQGDTIVEVLLSIAVLSAVLGISYSLASRSFRTLQISKDHIQATLILQEQAEGFRALRDEMGYAAFCATNRSNRRVVINPGNAWQEEAANGTYPTHSLYTVSSEIECLADARARITTHITWERLGGGTDQQTLVSELRDI